MAAARSEKCACTLLLHSAEGREDILVSRARKQVPRKRKLLAIVGIRIARCEVSGRA
jgi:hypothetical protein